MKATLQSIACLLPFNVAAFVVKTSPPRGLGSHRKVTMTSDTPTQEWDVQRYQSQHRFVWQYGSTLIDLVEPLQTNSRVLDVGCGTGELTHGLHKKYPAATVIGMDADPAMVAKAQQQFSNVKFFVGDVRNFEIEPVDLIFSNAALHWVPPHDAARAVTCMAKALQSNGQFVVEFGGRGNVQQIVNAVNQVMDLPSNSPLWYFPSVSEFTSFLVANDIEVTSAVLFDRPTKLEEGKDGMKNWLRMFGNKFWDHKAQHEVEAILEKVCEILKPSLYDINENQWTADYRRIRVAGRKL